MITLFIFFATEAAQIIQAHIKDPAYIRNVRTIIHLHIITINQENRLSISQHLVYKFHTPTFNHSTSIWQVTEPPYLLDAVIVLSSKNCSHNLT